MNEEEFSEHIKEIIRRVRSGEERVYSMEEVRVMLGIDEEQQRIEKEARIKVLEELVAEGQRLDLGE